VTSSGLPEPVVAAVTRHAGSEPVRSRAAHGGSINQAATVALADGREVFCKWHHRAPASFFEAEADGLRRLAATATVRVPEVLGVSDDPGGTSVLTLACIDASRTRQDEAMADLGRTLAALHGKRGLRPGLDRPNFIGSLHQPNTSADCWLTFFVERRLEPLSQALPSRLRSRLLALPFEHYLTEPEGGCALLHGDLWGGNAMTTADGLGYVIDPAVYAGHPEVDLAMTRLFGGFSASFYQGYQEVAGRFDGGLNDRLDLYNLYPLLVHVNLFGGGYVSQVADTVERFQA